MKLAIGLILAVCVGIGCRWFGIPLPGPPAIMGAAMAVAHHRGTVGEHAGKLITAIGAAIAIGAAVGIVGALAK